jgi:hypothetical protein
MSKAIYKWLEKNLSKLKKDRKTMTYTQLAEKWNTSETTVFMVLNPAARKRQAITLAWYKKKNRDKIRLQNKKATKVYREKHPERIMLYNAKYRAKRFSVPFSLTEADVPIPKFCPILGLKLEKQRDVHKNNSPSIDRINPKRGYVRGNVQVVSHRANYIKNNETDPKVFEAIAAYLRKQQRKS